MKKLVLLIILSIVTILPQSDLLLLKVYNKSYGSTYEVPSNSVMVVGTQSVHERNVLLSFIKGYQSTGGVWTGDTLTFTSTGNIQDAFDYAIANGYSTVIRSTTSAAVDTSKALLNYPGIQYFATTSNTNEQVYDTEIALPSLIMPGTSWNSSENLTGWNVEFLGIDSIDGEHNKSSYSNSYIAGQLCYIAHTLNVSYWTARYLARLTGSTYSVKNGYGLINISTCLSAYRNTINYDALDPYKYLPNASTVSLAKFGNAGITVTLTSSAGDDSTRLYKSTDGGSGYNWIKSLALNQSYIDTPLAYGTYYYKARNIKRMSLGGTSNIPSIYSGIDTIPNDFAFTDSVDCELSTEIISDSVVLAGFDSAYAYAGGASYRKGKYGNWITAYSRVYSGDTLWLKNTSSSENATAVNTTLTVGTKNNVWTITTVGGVEANNIIVFDTDYLSEAAIEADLSITITDYVHIADGDIHTVTFGNTGYDIPEFSVFGTIGSILSAKLSAANVLSEGLANNPNMSSVRLPLATYISTLAFSTCINLTTIYLPSCTTLGFSCDGDEGVFYNITGKTIALTVPSALMICNDGDPDGDIQTLQSVNTVTIINP